MLKDTLPGRPGSAGPSASEAQSRVQLPSSAQSQPRYAAVTPLPLPPPEFRHGSIQRPNQDTLSPGIHPRFQSGIVPSIPLPVLLNQNQSNQRRQHQSSTSDAPVPQEKALFPRTKLPNFRDIHMGPDGRQVSSVYPLATPASPSSITKTSVKKRTPVRAQAISNAYQQMVMLDQKRGYESAMCEPIHGGNYGYMVDNRLSREIQRHTNPAYRHSWGRVQPFGVMKTEPTGTSVSRDERARYAAGIPILTMPDYWNQGAALGMLPTGRGGAVQPMYILPVPQNGGYQWGGPSPKKMKMAEAKREKRRSPQAGPYLQKDGSLVTSDEGSRTASPPEPPLKTDPAGDDSMPTPIPRSLLNRLPGLVVKPEAGRPEWKPYELFVNSAVRKNKKTKIEKSVRGKTKTGWRHWTQPENIKLWELTAVYRSKRRYVQWKEVQKQYSAWTSENDYPSRSAKSLTTHYNDQLKKRKYRDRRGIHQP